MLNPTLSKLSNSIVRSILIYGQHGSGKDTITKYLAHQLRWKMITFDALELIQMESGAVSNILNEAYEYWLTKDETIIVIKNYDKALNIEHLNFKYYIVN